MDGLARALLAGAALLPPGTGWAWPWQPLAAAVPEEAAGEERAAAEAHEGPVGGILGLGVRAMFNAIAPGPRRALQPVPVDEAADGEMPKDPARAQLWQQRKQIRQQAKHMEQIFQPVLHTELEIIRQTCPGLAAEGRREVLAAGRTAVTKTALEFATRQFVDGPQQRADDARKSIRAPLAEALAAHAAAAEFAAYGREQAARGARRARAARVAIVAKLDRRLDLSAAQRQAIEDDLAAHWDESWSCELDDNGRVINGERAAPDYATTCIEPHLDEQQRAEWQRWRRAAGTAVVGINVGWTLDGQGLHEPDGWWTGGGER